MCRVEFSLEEFSVRHGRPSLTRRPARGHGSWAAHAHDAPPARAWAGRCRHAMAPVAQPDGVWKSTYQQNYFARDHDALPKVSAPAANRSAAARATLKMLPIAAEASRTSEANPVGPFNWRPDRSITMMFNHLNFRNGLRDDVLFSPTGSNSRKLTKSRSLPRMSGSSGAALHRKEPLDAEYVRQDFRRKLLRNYRTMLGAWRVLDPLGNGRLSFFDFCRASRQLGCPNTDARALWEALDVNHDGFVTLDEVDPPLAEMLLDFKACIAKASGSASAAWKQHFSSRAHGRCAIEPFENAARRLGYNGDVGAVFDALNVDGLPSGVSFKDFALLDKWFKSSNHGAWDYSGLRPTIILHTDDDAADAEEAFASASAPPSRSFAPRH